MIPASITGKIVEELARLLDEGDIIIDGGNSNYRDDVRRAAKLREQGLHYVDIGTSGGVFGLERGYCLMVGGTTKRSRSSTRS
jgi:6-phosphogluconate dehydrogenase